MEGSTVNGQVQPQADSAEVQRKAEIRPKGGLKEAGSKDAGRSHRVDGAELTARRQVQARGTGAPSRHTPALTTLVKNTYRPRTPASFNKGVQSRLRGTENLSLLATAISSLGNTSHQLCL